MKTVASLIAFVLLCGFSALQAQNYVGAAACKSCHSNPKMGGEAYKVWSTSKHAGAFKTLMTPEADKIAAGKGLKTKAAESPECLNCHVTNDGKLAANVKPADEGVGCEQCHGGAKDYKSKHGKGKDVKDAIAAGMQLPKVADGSAKKMCVTCHNEKSPTFKKFDLDAQWKAIAHGKAS
jgi:hypothetical protein